jgi:hypothetical protein
MKRLSWIEKLNRSLKVTVDDEIREKIMEGSASLTSASVQVISSSTLKRYSRNR